MSKLQKLSDEQLDPHLWSPWTIDGQTRHRGHRQLSLLVDILSINNPTMEMHGIVNTSEYLQINL